MDSIKKILEQTLSKARVSYESFNELAAIKQYLLGSIELIEEIQSNVAISINEKRNDVVSFVSMQDGYIIKDKPIMSVKESPSETHQVDVVDDVKLPCKITVPVAEKLSDIPKCLRWYRGDQKTPRGLYICIDENLIVQVPFPDICDIQNKTKIANCKYKTQEACAKYNKKQECLFVHIGQKYNKLSIYTRCPDRPNIGKHSSLAEDITFLNVDNLRPMLLYSLSDILIAIIWARAKNNRIVLTDLSVRRS